MLSSISPFQDYPNNPRTFICQRVASQKITPTFQQFNLNSVSPKTFLSQTQIHPKLSSQKYILSLTDLNQGPQFTNPSQI